MSVDKSVSADDLQKLRERLPGLEVRTDADALGHWGRDWLTFYAPRPAAVVFPRATEEVVDIVRWAIDAHCALVPSGGRTGLSGGATATAGEVVVSFDRMRQILDFDAGGGIVRCQAGVVTAELQAFAAQQGWFYPVDFASSGSSQIGGNVATNAGGVKVIRYGMTRERVAGLTVVAGTGERLEVGRSLVKNATGYDLRHLFVGSEGTLGLIAEVAVQLVRPPAAQQVMLLSVMTPEHLIPLLERFRRVVTLSAFEFFSDAALAQVCEARNLPLPLSGVAPWYALLEFDRPETDEALLGAFAAALDGGWIEDGVISQSEAQAATLWTYREAISESISRHSPYKNDVAVSVAKVPEFWRAVDDVVRRAYPQFELIWFGHIGDGNLHLNILKPPQRDLDEFRAECERVSEMVFECVQRFGGSVSAEHGVGLLKRGHIGFSRSEAELALMRGIKQVFDPHGILNPGKLLPPPDAVD